MSLNAKDEKLCSVSWMLVYRASLYGFGAREFHQACDGLGKFVVVVKAENGRIAAAYNGDGFNNVNARNPNRNGFIVSIKRMGVVDLDLIERRVQGEFIILQPLVLCSTLILLSQAIAKIMRDRSADWKGHMGVRIEQARPRCLVKNGFGSLIMKSTRLLLNRIPYSCIHRIRRTDKEIVV